MFIQQLDFNLNNIQVASFNVRGIGDTNKRRAIFNYLKQHNTSIVLLQEMHSCLEDETVWSNEWGNKIIFSHGTNKARGVAILLQKNSPVEINSISTDDEGRYLIADIVVGKYHLALVNAYGPNEDHPEFYTKLFNKLEESYENNSMIMGGDFNTALNTEKDLYNNKGLNHPKKRQIILEYLEKKNLVDVWRVRNPEKRTFSWRKSDSKEIIMSRLDYFFISEDLMLRVQDTDIKAKYRSDHSRITLTVNLADHKRGKSYWKINNKHLRNKGFLQLINNIILKHKWNVKNYNETNPETQWISLKELIISAARVLHHES